MKKVLIALLCFPLKGLAVRPFITDDARVVGYRLGQYESWLRFDEHAYQHWNMVAYGPTSKWELAFGFIHGVESPNKETREYSYAIPLLQAKYLFKEYKPNKAPGFAVAGGTFLPGGKGTFKAPGYGLFSYLAITQSFGKNDMILIHANMGASHVQHSNSNHTVMTWGLGTQIRVIGGMHLVSEYFSGDPYVPGSGTAYQMGFRYFMSDFIQLDMTIGEGLVGTNKLPFWGGVGVRIVTAQFARKN